VGASATTETARPGHGNRRVTLALSQHTGYCVPPPAKPRGHGITPDRVAPSQHLGARTASCSKAGTGPAATTGASACTVRGGVQTVASTNPEDPPRHDDLNGQRHCPGGAAHAYGGTTASHASNDANGYSGPAMGGYRYGTPDTRPRETLAHRHPLIRRGEELGRPDATGTHPDDRTAIPAGGPDRPTCHRATVLHTLRPSDLSQPQQPAAVIFRGLHTGTPSPRARP